MSKNNDSNKKKKKKRNRRRTTTTTIATTTKVMYANRPICSSIAVKLNFIFAGAAILGVSWK